MNILEHINAGHYPVDDKGRALVPMRDGLIATVCATDAPGPWCIIGWHSGNEFGGTGWDADGAIGVYGARGRDLTPPPPRKVKVTAWAVKGRTHVIDHFHDEHKARAYAATFKERHGSATVIELTGEYEEPWS